MTSRRKLEARLRKWYRFTSPYGWSNNERATRGFLQAYNRVVDAHNRRNYLRDLREGN